MSAAIFHIAERAVWDRVTDDAPYTMSTIDTTLAEEGFIHCSATDAQVQAVLDRYYQGVPDLVLLVIDPTNLDVRHEPSNGDIYPHIYEPLPRNAVQEVRTLPDTR